MHAGIKVSFSSFIAFHYICYASMISNRNLVHYACIAKETMVLAQYASNEPNIIDLATKCLQQAPPHHSIFSHTTKKRTYTFLIDQKFVFFAIFDENLDKTEALWFLDHIKCGLDTMLKQKDMSIMNYDDALLPLCFQAEFDPIFGESMALDLQMEKPLPCENKDDQNPSVGSVKGKKVTFLLEQPREGLKKKKTVSTEGNGIDGTMLEKKLDVCDDDRDGFATDFAMSVSKSGAIDGYKARQIWKKHMRVVLLLDIFVCTVLFVIWLGVCRGISCMRS